MSLISRLWVTTAISALLCACASSTSQGGAPHYSMADFATVRKLDSHVHVEVLGSAFLDVARADHFELMSINVDYPDFPALPDQRAAALAQLAKDPARL